MIDQAFVICTDSNYAAHAGTCIFSLLLSTSRRDFDIHVLGVGLAQRDQFKFLHLSKLFNISVFVHEAMDSLNIFAESNSAHRDHRTAHLSDTALLRLIYSSIIDQSYNKLVYVDCDVVFVGDATLIFGLNLQGAVIGAAPDLIASRQADTGVKSDYQYFNSGVLLIDDKKWRKENIQRRLLDVFVSADPKSLKYADQDILNLFFRDLGYMKMPLIYNYQYMATLSSVLAPEEIPLEKAVALHFAGQIKPWQQWAPLSYRQLYEKYRVLSPWATKYIPDKPQGAHQLSIAFDSLIHQKRFSEACDYGPLLVEQLRKQKNHTNTAMEVASIVQSRYLLKRMIDQKVYKYILDSHGSSVLYGPFAGMKYKTVVTWRDPTLKLLGLYESCLHKILAQIIDRYKGCDLINLGCAEGYYAAGLGRALDSPNIVVRDIEEASLQACKGLVEANCPNSLLHVGGMADSADLANILQKFPHSLIVCDIEGAELDLFKDPTWFNLAKSSVILVEIHSFIDRSIKNIILSSSLNITHQISIIKESEVTPSAIPELSALDGLTRSLVCCESRPELMEWLLLDPFD